jgi:RNA polymerase sigma-70 factor (ECF subfamily)
MVLAEVGGWRGGPTASDEELMVRMARGEAAALEAVYDRYGRVAYSLALRILDDRGAAEEVVQDAFVGLWRSAGGYDVRRGGLYPWLVRIVRNRAIDELRRLKVPGRAPHAARKALSPEVLDFREPYWDVPHHDGGTPEDRIAVGDAVLGLPEDQRLVIELAYYGGLSQREISEQTGLPLGTVKTRTRLALKKLRAVLDVPPGGLAADGPAAGEA